MNKTIMGVMICVALLVATEAVAQKSQDTLRFSIEEATNMISRHHLPSEEGGLFYNTVYQTLMAYDQRKQIYAPSLAKSWKRTNDRTLEFELREDVTFHNGNKFDADDVVATLEYLLLPDVSLPFKSRYSWLDKVEKLGPYKVRFVSKKTNATDMSLIANVFDIWDAETLATHKDKVDYGRLTPIGTGPYKVTLLDKNKGVHLERNDKYVGDKNYYRAPITHLQAIPLPDPDTRIAQLLTGGIELVRNATPDQARELSANPDLSVTNVPAAYLLYVALDSVGRSGAKPMSDPRVRRAMFMAIDRDTIISEFIPGGKDGAAERIQALCFKDTVGCKYSVKLPAYDPAGAKKLLAEAGYPDGFDVEYDVLAANKDVAQAITGYLRAIGVRASVNTNPISLIRRKQGDGKLQMWSIASGSGTFPDAGNILSILYAPTTLPYYQDSVIPDLLAAGAQELDPKKRADIYQKVFDRSNEMSYILPVTSVPTIHVHSKQMKIAPNLRYTGSTSIDDYFWN